MGAFFEEVEGIIRVGKYTYRYGDPYTHCVAIKKIDEETCEMLGYSVENSSSPLVVYLVDALECVGKLGYKRCIIKRIREDGKEKTTIYNIQNVLERHQRQNNVGE